MSHTLAAHCSYRVWLVKQIREGPGHVLVQVTDRHIRRELSYSYNTLPLRATHVEAPASGRHHGDVTSARLCTSPVRLMRRTWRYRGGPLAQYRGSQHAPQDVSSLLVMTLSDIRTFMIMALVRIGRRWLCKRGWGFKLG